MRDTATQKTNGRVVASVVAVLEKQQCPIVEKNSSQIGPNKNQINGQRTTTLQATSGDKNRPTKSSLDASFQSAVDVFNSVALDVENYVTKTNSLKRFKPKKFREDYNSLPRIANVSKDFQNEFKWGPATTKNNRKEQASSTKPVVIPAIKLEGQKQKPSYESLLLGLCAQISPERTVSPVDSLDEPPITPKKDKNDSILVQFNILSPSKDTSSLDKNVTTSALENTTKLLKETSSVSGSASKGLVDSDSSDPASENDSDFENITSEGLATITEEERNSASSAQSLRKDEHEEHFSTSTTDEDPTLKADNLKWQENASSSLCESTSDISTTSEEHPVGKKNPSEGSTRCNSDFQWIRSDSSASSSKKRSLTPKMDYTEPLLLPLNKPPINRSIRDKTPTKKAPGSLDRRRHNVPRQEREQKSRSQHLKSPPKLDDFQPCQNWCCSTPPPAPHELYFENFNRRHERMDPQRYGSSPMLMEHRGSHGDIYGDFGGRFRDMGGCCSYHVAPPPSPCCYYGGDTRGYRWTPPPYPKPGEQDEKLRKLQFEKDNLQLQVQVLSEQIEAQSDKILDLEKSLHERKLVMAESDEKLQREMLSRSSLETQKLELMTIISDLKLQQAALERENMDLKSANFNNNGDIKRPPLIPRMSPQPHLTSTPVHHPSNQVLQRKSPSPSPVQNMGLTRDFSENQPPKTPPASYKRQIDIHYSSLPRQQFLSNGIDANANAPRKGVAFGRGISTFMGLRSKGVSAPNLAQTEKIVIEDNIDAAQLTLNKNKGIKKIFGKIKRSNSGTLEDLPLGGEFQRGGIRATASARLGWSEPQLSIKPDKPFIEWDTENICDWLQDLGLDQYVTDAKRWIKNGQQLQEASMAEIEKELNIKNALHRKKLQLALIDTQENGSSDPFLKKAGELDTAWVLRWLDDTGLPQHKENFLINRVDGRVLHRLTLDDLALLHVTSMLHVASIKRGIHVLRENNYEPGCLQRRSLPEESDQPMPRHISLWTTHRVMEWLRAVDLAEYAPNLRGAGVHGGLMVYETKFTAELLAALLSIPREKTLLRRHLNTRFKELLGKDIIQEKREAESTLGYIPLTPSSKLKVSKKSQFSLKRKKSKGEADYGDLVCPLNQDKSDDEDGKPRGRGCLSR